MNENLRAAVHPESPAAGANKLRLKKYIAIQATTLGFFALGILVGTQLGEVAALVTFVAYAVATLTIAYYTTSYPCPRCGWNLFMRKAEISFDYNAWTIPDRCPGCGLDLTVPYCP